MNACPKGAISFFQDEFGFGYPEINNDLCIGCGSCIRACGFKKLPTKNYPVKTYAAAAKDIDILKKSASGGAFAVLARKTIEKGGMVYGAALNISDNKFLPEHICVSKSENLSKLQGSKYVQSDVGYIFREIQERISSGKQIVFSGTPCQVAGLRKYLGKDYDNLICIDIICHGVPGTKLFSDYMNYRSQKLKGNIQEFYFRDKTKGQGYTTRTVLKTDKKTISHIRVGEKDAYIRFFSKSLTLRDNCYNCPFATKERVGDITLGDYWGFHKENPNIRISGLNDRLGVSCILCNTDRGIRLLNECIDDFVIIESEYDKIYKNNKQLNGATEKPELRQFVLQTYQNGGYDALEKLYSRKWYKDKIKYTISGLIPISVKKIIKNAINRA